MTAVQIELGKPYLNLETKAVGTVLNGFTLHNGEWVVFEVETPRGIERWDVEDMVRVYPVVRGD